ncbi:MAG: aspartate aminotransferase family protein [Phenylobacterium sp.]|uniref:pyridoxal phosphate-dependent decarboxylase family protein n=1 Tax=Phenylobacterium sp. TaxID=1871053 RepID=UPI0017FF2FBD|nr:aspartate aminotransferase family protein [Phenylobacterium sp.]MBA4794385.1 aspartate aminotransferase family protein [Phenylobacterium sp.]
MTALPKTGAAWAEVAERMRQMAGGDVKWRDGKAAVYVFNAGPEIEQVQKEAYALFASENGLGPAAFPSLRQMEAEVVGFGLSLLHGPEGAVGNMTSGGTDSILMAVKAARDFARQDRGLTGPLNLVLPRSAHPAFDKACAVMEIEVRRTPLAGLLADPDAIEAACDDRTIMIVGSAPCFPYGLIDPIAALGELAQRKALWLHVDACVGGYIAPFVRMNGAPVPAFDFEVPGVSSMSADLHKYGYCAKGASTVFFRSEALRRRMIFEVGDWPASKMVTPTLAGTRPGGAIAAAWAVMNVLGEEGYRAKHGEVTAAREAIEAGVRSQGWRVLGEPLLGITAFTREDLNPFAVLKKLFERGWVTSAVTEPRGLHLMLSPVHLAVADRYLEDLAWASDAARADGGKPAEARYGG